jgi:hypothetical protein
MDRPTAYQPRRARQARRNGQAWRAAVAGILACALILFTTVYRHSNAFSLATAARIHALSTDHTDARTLFAGEFGPLAILVDAPLLATTADRPSEAAAAPRVTPERPLALRVVPLERPPPPRPV